MINKRFKINNLAVLFHPELDRKNGYNTVLQNPKTGNFLFVDKQGYTMLKTIDDSPGIDSEQLIEKLHDLSVDKIEGQLKIFLSENIILET